MAATTATTRHFARNMARIPPSKLSVRNRAELLSNPEAEALAALDTADVVLAPDADGGYGLVGLRRPVPGLFEHAMSTGRVFEDTRANALERGLRVATVCAGFDLDTVADLSRLARARGEHAERLCPRTLSFLDTHDIWQFAAAG